MPPKTVRQHLERLKAFLQSYRFPPRFVVFVLRSDQS